MFETLAELFSYGFVVRAVVAGVLISLCAALLGVSLVLKRFSMIGDGLSHVGFGALAVALSLNWAPLAVALPVVLAAAFLLLRIGEGGGMRGDAAIALLSSGALAVGVIVISQTTGMNADVYNYMFGSILTLTDADLFLSAGICLAALILYVLFYNRLFAVTFDPEFAKAGGMRTGAYNMLLAGLTALVVTAGMRMAGAMLMSSLIIFPALTAMRLFKSFRRVVIASAVTSAVCFLTGIIASFLFDTPAGASVVAVNLTVFAAVFCIGRLRGKRG
jgi:zinc transport system permease protein